MLCAAPALPDSTITNVPQYSASAAAQSGISAATHPWMAALDMKNVSFVAPLLEEETKIGISLRRDNIPLTNSHWSVNICWLFIVIPLARNRIKGKKPQNVREDWDWGKARGCSKAGDWREAGGIWERSVLGEKPEKPEEGKNPGPEHGSDREAGDGNDGDENSDDDDCGDHDC